jgi:hypothetical protein
MKTFIFSALVTLSLSLSALASDCSTEIKDAIRKDFRTTKDFNLAEPKLDGETSTHKDKYTATVFYVDKTGGDCSVPYIVFTRARTCEVVNVVSGAVDCD